MLFRVQKTCYLLLPFFTDLTAWSSEQVFSDETLATIQIKYYQ